MKLKHQLVFIEKGPILALFGLRGDSLSENVNKVVPSTTSKYFHGAQSAYYASH